MNRADAWVSPLNEFLSGVPLASGFAAMVALSACSLAGPPPAEYVLGPIPAGKATTIPQPGLPIVEVERVRVPDYLDTTDILRREGNRLVPSPTGRWGERLSVGLTRALTASLSLRLPRMVVTATSPLERPTWQILVDLADFEPSEDKVVLVARWTIVEGARHRIVDSEQTSLVDAIPDADDSAVVAAMSHLVEELADRLVAGIESSRPA